VAPNTERYVAGRNEGLKSFCTYELPRRLPPKPRLEALTREAEQLELRIQQFK
jgi:hypothetical protein